jgi:hypothetical protein
MAVAYSTRSVSSRRFDSLSAARFSAIAERVCSMSSPSVLTRSVAFSNSNVI